MPFPLREAQLEALQSVEERKVIKLRQPKKEYEKSRQLSVATNVWRELEAIRPVIAAEIGLGKVSYSQAVAYLIKRYKDRDATRHQPRQSEDQREAGADSVPTLV